MIRLRHQQPSLWETFFADEVEELWEPWMRVVDEVLEDDELLDTVYDAQGKRHTQSRTRQGQAPNARGGCAADADSEACSQLEL